MKINNYVLIVLSIVFLILVGLASRALYLIPANIATGEYKDSLDKKFVASVMDSYSESFWGEERHWFEFELTEKDTGKRIQILETSPIRGPYFGSRSSHNVIFWNEESTEVVFKFPNTIIRMRLNAL